MRHPNRIARLGSLAVGLGIGAAIAATPWVASADPLPPFDPNNFAISFDGMTFTQGSAQANSGMGDFAFADGANSFASAEGGFGDVASATGAGSEALAGDGVHLGTGNNFDFASAYGNFGASMAGFGGSFDSASEVGNNSSANAGFGQDTVPINFADFDTASVLGDLSKASAVAGSNDLAFVSDPGGAVGSIAIAGNEFGGLPGNFDLGGVMGDGLTQLSLGDLVVHIAQFF
jgi:hypothetical protein